MYTDSEFFDYLNLRAVNSIRDFSDEVPQEAVAEAQPETMQLQMSPSISGATGGMTPARTEYEQKKLDKQRQLLEKPILDFQNLFNEVDRLRNEFKDLFPSLPQEVDPSLSKDAGYGADAGTFTGKGVQVTGLGDIQLSTEAFKPIGGAPQTTQAQLTTGFKEVAEEEHLRKMEGVVSAIGPKASETAFSEWKPSTPRDYYTLGAEKVFKSIGLSEQSARDLAANLIGVRHGDLSDIGIADFEPFSLAAEGGRSVARGIRDDSKAEMAFGLIDAAAAIFPPAKALKTAKAKEAARAFDAKMESLGYKKIGIETIDSPQQNPMSVTTRGDSVRNLIEGYQPSGRMNVNAQLKGIISAGESGKLDDAGFKQAVSNLQTEIANRQVHKAAQYVEPARGHDSLVAKLRDEVKKKRITKEAADMVEWVSLKNPNLAQNLTASSNKKLMPERAGGIYLLNEQKIVFRGAQDALELMRVGASEVRTPVHEFLHHTERLLPQDVRNGVAQLWWKHSSDRLLKAIKSGDNELVDYLRLSMSGDTAEAAKKFISMQHKDIGTLYQYANASEFWAENGSRIIQSRSIGDLGDKSASYYRELAEKMKDIVGASNDNAIYKAMRDLKSAPADVSGRLMSRSKITAPTGITRGEKVATGVAASSAAIAGKAGYDARERRMQERAGGK